MKQIISIIAISTFTVFASCSSSSNKEEVALQARQKTIDSLQSELAKQQIIDSMNEVAATQLAAAKAATATVKKTKRSTPVRSTSYQQNSVGTYTGNVQSPVAVDQPVTTPEKRGWSAKAKGAVIGTAAGAAAGAVINKRNRAAGAVIGGVLGAGAGTGVGAVIDKKNGR